MGIWHQENTKFGHMTIATHQQSKVRGSETARIHTYMAVSVELTAVLSKA